MQGLFFIRAVTVILAMTAYYTGSDLLADGKGPVIPKAAGEHCVAETGFMRRNHMDLIVHQRDETVIKGIRDEPFSLVECVDCHVQRDANNVPIRIDAEGQFCASCHTFVAAKIDCFTCHAAIPDPIDGDRADAQHWLTDDQMLAMSLHTFSSPIAPESKADDDQPSSRQAE